MVDAGAPSRLACGPVVWFLSKGRLAAIALLAAACATAPASEEGSRRDAGPTADGGRPIGGRPDAGLPDAGRPDAAVDSGRPDAAPPGDLPRINELVADHAGTDLCEFVEIIGDPRTDYSDHAILVIEGDTGANPGSVDVAIPLATTDDVGLFATAPLSSQIENGSTTLLLVSGFAGGVVDLDIDDDGTLDEEPWSSLLDAVAISDGGAADLLYAGSVVLGPLYDGVQFPPGGASRIPDGVDTDEPRDWIRNDFDGEGLGCGDGSPVAGEALNTPGTINREALLP